MTKINWYDIIKEIEATTGVPLLYVSGTRRSLEAFASGCPAYKGGVIELDIMTRPEWLE